MRAVRAMRSARLDRRLRVDGLRRLDLAWPADVLAVRFFEVADLCVEVLTLALADVFFLLDVECDTADFWLSAGIPATGARITNSASAAARLLPDSRI